MSNETERIVWYDVSKRYCSRVAQTATDFADVRIPNRQNLLPPLYHTAFSVQKMPTRVQ